MFSGKPFEWVPCLPARIFISPTSDTPTFKSFLLQLFFRETMNGQSIEKKTLTSTFPNNLRSMRLAVFSGGFSFVLKASSDLSNRVKKTQWLTSDKWRRLLHSGQKLAVDSQKADTKKSKFRHAFRHGFSPSRRLQGLGESVLKLKVWDENLFSDSVEWSAKKYKERYLLM